jgi:flagellin-like hook-associated protein FlgL
MTKEENPFNSGDRVNIFMETSLGSDPDLAEVANTELIEEASVKYERAIADIDAKETKLDLQLSRIEAQHHALKTEYDSVKKIVSKNIDRSFKTFNA